MSTIVNITVDNFERYQDEILEIEKSSFPSPWSPHAFREELTRLVSHLWALTIDEHVAGYISFWMFAREIHIMNIAVNSKRRGKGLGRHLLTKMIEEGISKGVNTVWLEVRPSNLMARIMYERAGFEEIGRRPRYYRDTNEDAIVMSLTLCQNEANLPQPNEPPRCEHMH